MTSIFATEAGKTHYRLLDQVSGSHEPVQITGKRGNAVLVSEDGWRAVQETLSLVSIPGMRDSIVEGMKTPVDELEDTLASWRLVYTKAAQKDAKGLAAAGLRAKARSPLDVIAKTEPAVVREAGGRPHEGVFAADQHHASPRIPGPREGLRRQGAQGLVALRVGLTRASSRTVRLDAYNRRVDGERRAAAYAEQRHAGT
jgi:antitoxin YefM